MINEVGRVLTQGNPADSFFFAVTTLPRKRHSSAMANAERFMCQ